MGKGSRARNNDTQNWRDNYDKIFGDHCRLNHSHDEFCDGFERGLLGEKGDKRSDGSGGTTTPTSNEDV